MNVPSQRLRPRFIVLEGIDGSGTTTQLERLSRYLVTAGRRVHSTREPSQGPIGQLLRELLLGQHRAVGGAPVDERTMALLFAADRRDHLTREIRPALASGHDVVSDRYVLSSLAYQSVESDRAWVATLAEGILQPDLTILLDVSIATALERRTLAGRPIERYDEDGIQSRVAENYRRLAMGDSRVATIDGAGTVDDVAFRIIDAVDRTFGSGSSGNE